jgi:hypothetical protein
MDLDSSKVEEASDDEVCPLFMNGLPKDFMKNPQLAALASLITDEDKIDCPNSEDVGLLNLPKISKEVLEESIVQTNDIGKKLFVKLSDSRMKRQVNKRCPYWKPTSTERERSKSSTNSSLGEAQLFLKMWSL